MRPRAQLRLSLFFVARLAAGSRQSPLCKLGAAAEARSGCVWGWCTQLRLRPGPGTGAARVRVRRKWLWRTPPSTPWPLPHRLHASATPPARAAAAGALTAKTHRAPSPVRPRRRGCGAGWCGCGVPVGERHERGGAHPAHQHGEQPADERQQPASSTGRAVAGKAYGQSGSPRPRPVGRACPHGSQPQ